MVSRSQEIQSLEVDPWQDGVFFWVGGGGAFVGRVSSCWPPGVCSGSRGAFRSLGVCEVRDFSGGRGLHGLSFGFKGSQRLQFGIWLLIWGPQSFWGVVGGLWCLLGFSQLRSKQWCDFMRSSQAENSSIDDDDVIWGMMLLLLGMASLTRNLT